MLQQQEEQNLPSHAVRSAIGKNGGKTIELFCAIPCKCIIQMRANGPTGKKGHAAAAFKWRRRLYLSAIRSTFELVRQIVVFFFRSHNYYENFVPVLWIFLFRASLPLPVPSFQLAGLCKKTPLCLSDVRPSGAK
jgi:hypothetical protein